MRYRSWGAKGRPGLVLLHALGCHKGWWDWVGAALADQYYVLAPDLRGHGESRWAEQYRFSDYAEDVERFVTDLELQEYTLVGHSMGGYVGLAVASRQLKPPTALLVVDMKTRSSPQELADLQAAAQRPGRTFATLEEAVVRYRLSPPEHAVPEDRLAQVAAETYRQQPDGTWVERFDRRALAIEPVEPLPLVQQLRCAVRFVRGERSLVMPEEASALAEAASTELITMPGLYHHLPLEDPERVSTTIRQFLAR